jgi:predicted RNA binding protein YcfA (HicA-like mRNA interferase family)
MPAAEALHADISTGRALYHGTVIVSGYFGSMPPLPRVTGRDLKRALGKLGWELVRQKGSHAQLKHPSRDGRVTIPLHAGETIGPGLLRSILNDAGISADELREVL